MSIELFRNTLAPVAILCCTSLGVQAWATESPYLLGDWNGSRSRLAAQGIIFDAGYVSEVAHNVTGGTQHLTRYADQWQFGASLDLETLWGWKGGTFQIVYTDRNGRDLGADAQIGNNQLLQEVYGRGQTLHLTLFALSQTFLAGKLDWRIGRLPVGEDFDSFSCNFQNLTFCGAQPGNLVGDYWVNWPTSQWATRLKLQTTDRTYVQIGAYQVNPNYVDDSYARRNGWKLDFPSGTTGALIPVEFVWQPVFNDRPGNYKAGVWYSTADGPDLYWDIHHQPIALSGDPALQHDHRYGAYLSFQQQISGTANGAGATVFLNVTQADRDTSATDRQIALGMEYKGLFKRAADTVGFAIGATHANSRAADYQRLYNQVNPDTPGLVKDGNEYVAEMFYGWSPLPSITLRPNLQYVLHPGGTSQNNNAFVIGLKSSVAF
ncbi:MAG: carbohydrate porin [Gammaproteobacteria bacterium]